MAGQCLLCSKPFIIEPVKKIVSCICGKCLGNSPECIFYFCTPCRELVCKTSSKEKSRGKSIRHVDRVGPIGRVDGIGDIDIPINGEWSESEKKERDWSCRHKREGTVESCHICWEYTCLAKRCTGHGAECSTCLLVMCFNCYSNPCPSCISYKTLAALTRS